MRPCTELWWVIVVTFFHLLLLSLRLGYSCVAHCDVTVDAGIAALVRLGPHLLAEVLGGFLQGSSYSTCVWLGQLESTFKSPTVESLSAISRDDHGCTVRYLAPACSSPAFRVLPHEGFVLRHSIGYSLSCNHKVVRKSLYALQMTRALSIWSHINRCPASRSRLRIRIKSDVSRSTCDHHILWRIVSIKDVLSTRKDVTLDRYTQRVGSHGRSSTFFDLRLLVPWQPV